MKFRKKPVIIDAIKFTGDNNMAIQQFLGSQLVSNGDIAEILIPTLEGEMKAVVGDWIIKGVKGEFYPCKPDVFEMTYENIY